MAEHELVLRQKSIGGRRIAVLTFSKEENSLEVSVNGIIGNSVPTSNKGKHRTAAWKVNVACQAKKIRGTNPWTPSYEYAITLGLSFYPPLRRNQKFDVENYMKPTLDALAAGLFCENDQSIEQIKQYNFDDSNFRYLFIYQLPPAPSESSEGAAIYVSVIKA